MSEQSEPSTFGNTSASISEKLADLLNDARVQDGLKHGHIPECFVCNHPLKDGDRLDHFWPHYVENNLCAKCEEKVVDGES